MIAHKHNNENKFNNMKKIKIAFIISFLVLICNADLFSQNQEDSIVSPKILNSESLNINFNNFNNKFILESTYKSEQNLLFKLYNITGDCIKILNCEIESGKAIEIPNDLYSGIYIVVIENKNIKLTKKFLVKQ